MFKMRKILAIVVAISAGGLFCSIESKEEKKLSDNGSTEKIWSTFEVSTGNKVINSDVLAMQGGFYDSDVEYDQVIPIGAKVENDHYNTDFDEDMYQLDSAMEESREIMKSLNIQSAQYVDNAYAVISEANQMVIEEFEIQKMMPEKQGISKCLENQVISKVDIVMPKSKISKSSHLNDEDPRVISSATIKVVDVLLEHGEDARALSMIEHALLGAELN